MLKAVVFDMDATLIDINLSAFIAVLTRDEAALMADIGRKSTLTAVAAYGSALYAVNGGGRADDDDRTNRELFNSVIERRLGLRLDDPVIAEAFSCYERDMLPRRNGALIHARPKKGAPEAIDCVLSHGLKTALLTNPGFSRDCIQARMAWGGLEDVPFELVTYMENSTRCKPSPRYYLESLGKMGLAPEEALMVGNDPRRDFPAPDCGLQTAYVGDGRPVRATWAGDMADFASSFDEICERFEERRGRRPLGLVRDAGRR